MTTFPHRVINFREMISQNYLQQFYQCSINTCYCLQWLNNLPLSSEISYFPCVDTGLRRLTVLKIAKLDAQVQTRMVKTRTTGNKTHF